MALDSCETCAGDIASSKVNQAEGVADKHVCSGAGLCPRVSAIDDSYDCANCCTVSTLKDEESQEETSGSDADDQACPPGEMASFENEQEMVLSMCCRSEQCPVVVYDETDCSVRSCSDCAVTCTSNKFSASVSERSHS